MNVLGEQVTLTVTSKEEEKLTDNKGYNASSKRIKDTLDSIHKIHSQMYDSCWKVSELYEKNGDIEKSIFELEALENTLVILEAQNYSDFEKSLNLDKLGVQLNLPVWKKGELKEKVEKEDASTKKFQIKHLNLSEQTLKTENLNTKTSDEIQSEIYILRNELVQMRNKELTQEEELKKVLCELALKTRELYLAGKMNK